MFNVSNFKLSLRLDKAVCTYTLMSDMYLSMMQNICLSYIITKEGINERKLTNI